jgi:hypothetical protein
VSAPSPRAVRHDRSIFVAYAVMLAIPLLLLRVPVLGNGTWIGNPDRLNNQLKLLLFYVRGIASENLAAWNEHEMLGFDSFVMPGIFPGPTTWLSAAFEGPAFLHAEGWLTVVMLVLTGVAALGFLRTIGSGWFEAVVGAACYQLCGVTILRVSQYDISAAILIGIPLALLLVRAARRERAVVVSRPGCRTGFNAAVHDASVGCLCSDADRRLRGVARPMREERNPGCLDCGQHRGGGRDCIPSACGECARDPAVFARHAGRRSSRFRCGV